MNNYIELTNDDVRKCQHSGKYLIDPDMYVCNHKQAIKKCCLAPTTLSACPLTMLELLEMLFGKVC